MRIAAIDVGSNSIHMVIAQVESDGRFRVLDRAKEMVRLGRGSLRSGRLSAEAMNAGLRTLSAFRTLGERQGVERFKAVATSAVRETRNGGDFIQRVYDDVGLRVKVIPGREEARLIYLGVRHAIDLHGAETLIVDAGGGSVELVVVEDDRPTGLHSLKIGVARLSEEFVGDDALGAQGVAQIEAHLHQHLDPILAPLAKRDIRRVVATSGTLLNVITIAAFQRGEPPDGHLNNCVATAEEIAHVRRLVTKADRAERLRIKGLDAKRSDIIVAGACLADHILRQLDAKEMVACTWALREGLLLDFIAKHRKGIEEIERFADVRRRSVARFVRHLGGTEQHGQQVARIALRLFDQLSSALGLEPAAREWLEFAALLHDVGHHIGHENHHRHSYYLITNGDLLGFQRDELELIALVARYHQKGAPKGSDDAFAELPSAERRTVRALSAILRVADGLDRSHYGVVRDVTMTQRSDRWLLQLQTDGDDAELEIWEARRRAEPLEKLLDTAVDFRVIP
ncbi:MAG: Ppx/GppA family phosphatase [Deltaproteobacteria bacterium]|nr:Ppx/GppA family phosphatase [Deltaproteobacteria bacterium]MBI3386705.1 Ppx/GppA family phosphatase [Deltaproteobacteria bacterium]